MVKYENIIKAMGEYVSKCRTIADMKEKLSALSLDEQYRQLVEQDLLNPLEKKDFEERLANIKHFEELESKIDPNKKEHLLEMIKETEEEEREELFIYGRRLYEGLKRNDPPIINRDKYQEDVQYDDMDTLWDFNTIGEIELQQVIQQNKLITEDSLTDDERFAVDWYFLGSLKSVNQGLNHNGYLSRLEGERKRNVSGLDSSIDKSGGLLQDTVLYHGGHFDIHLNVGDHGTFKNYVSCSFQKLVGEEYKSYSDTRMNYIIYAPKGRKGICGNVRLFDSSSYWFEHEFLLGRNTGFTVLNIDYDKGEVEIVLDE